MAPQSCLHLEKFGLSISKVQVGGPGVSSEMWGPGPAKRDVHEEGLKQKGSTHCRCG